MYVRSCQCFFEFAVETASNMPKSNEAYAWICIALTLNNAWYRRGQNLTFIHGEQYAIALYGGNGFDEISYYKM